MKVAYIKNHIDWDRDGIFDKYFIKAFLQRADVDIYTNNLPARTPEYLLGKGMHRFHAYRFRSFGPTFLTYFHVWWKLKRLEKRYDYLVTDWEFYNVANALLDSPKSIIYFQTPERAFYDLYDYRILTKRNIFRRIIQHLWVRQRLLDNIIVRKSRRALIIGNSNNVVKRIYKAYLQNAVAIYPAPALRRDVKPKQVPGLAGKRFFFTVSRIIPEKRIEIMIDAFKQMPDKLLVVAGWFSTAKYVRELREQAKHQVNVVFLDRVSDAEVQWLYANCEAVILTALDEDYGMVPAEAMEAGKPVIAVPEGGFCESVVPQLTGVFLMAPYEESLVETVRDFRASDFDPNKIRRYVREHSSYEVFVARLWKYIELHRRKHAVQR